jgi:hypothetical protein
MRLAHRHRIKIGKTGRSIFRSVEAAGAVHGQSFLLRPYGPQ